MVIFSLQDTYTIIQYCNSRQRSVSTVVADTGDQDAAVYKCDWLWGGTCKEPAEDQNPVQRYQHFVRLQTCRSVCAALRSWCYTWWQDPNVRNSLVIMQKSGAKGDFRLHANGCDW